jgi:ketosteroid isomerase-like protein
MPPPMHALLRILPFPALFALAAVALAQSGPTLEAEIVAADQSFFAALFDRCDIDALAPMVTDDFEFVHDKWGQIARSKAEFLTSIRSMCERQSIGTDFSARRVLVPGSNAVYPMKSYGAYQTGIHRFFRITPGKPDEATETARFAHLRRFTQGQWQLSRVVSFDHVDGAEPRQP